MQGRTYSQTMLTAFGWTRSARRGSWAMLLALALVLASFMQVVHTHDADAPASHKLCSFCTTLDRGGAPPPVIPAATAATATFVVARVATIAAPTGTATRTPHQPRAPPALQA